MEMEKIIDFNLYLVENRKKTREYKKASDFAGLNCLKVTLPHDIALSATEYRTQDQLFYGANICALQDYENVHAYYFTEFTHKAGQYKLVFNRVDVYSEIYLNGEKILQTDNAFISYEKQVTLSENNQLVIHILPAMIKSRENEIPAITNMLQFSYPSAYMRKPMHLLGWDIFPRNVLGGIFDAVKIEQIKADEIKGVYVYTNKIKDDSANLLVSYFLNVSGDMLKDYEIEITGKCEDSEFYYRRRLWFVADKVSVTVKNPKLWTVNNFGKPYLYDFKVTLYKDGAAVDEYARKIGIRTVKLDRHDDENGGKFDFIVNGERAFIKGINWVPLSTLHSDCGDKYRKAFNYLKELSLNMIRVWGGGFYETDEFYDFCDQNGILVWQDFMMTCGIYPWNDKFAAIMKEEAEYVVKRLRNHPSLALWAGDNECDMDANRWDAKLDPTRNIITRKVLKEVTYLHDPSREYLPSSPYISKFIFETKNQPSEAHAWGPRNYFKSKFYNSIKSAFVSENGYMGFPSTDSLKRFIPQDKLNDMQAMEYTIHSTNPCEDSFFNFRMNMTVNEIKETFDRVPECIEEKVIACQIAQAEADKFFIEYLRTKKDVRGGILIWNLIDGWPQISDSLVDYYDQKKIAFDYVKRSYADFTLMMEERGKRLNVYAVNDLASDRTFEYEIVLVNTGKVVARGKKLSKANSLTLCKKLKKRGERDFYLIKWRTDSECGTNHFVCDIQGIKLEEYIRLAKKCGIIN